MQLILYALPASHFEAKYLNIIRWNIFQFSTFLRSLMELGAQRLTRFPCAFSEYAWLPRWLPWNAARIDLWPYTANTKTRCTGFQSIYLTLFTRRGSAPGRRVGAITLYFRQWSNRLVVFADGKKRRNRFLVNTVLLITPPMTPRSDRWLVGVICLSGTQEKRDWNSRSIVDDFASIFCQCTLEQSPLIIGTPGSLCWRFSRGNTPGVPVHSSLSFTHVHSNMSGSDLCIG